MEEPRHRLIRYIDDAHAAEVGIAEILQGFVDETKEPAARSAFEDHLVQTKDQALRLERRLRDLGAEPGGGKSFLHSMLGKISDMMGGAHDTYDKTTQNLIKAYGTEHLEMGMYAALAAFAKSYGDQDTSALAEQIMAEEQQAADRVRPLIAACSAETFAASSRKAA